MEKFLLESMYNLFYATSIIVLNQKNGVYDILTKRKLHQHITRRCIVPRHFPVSIEPQIMRQD